MEIVPHPKAPLFTAKSAPLLLEQIKAEVTSPNFQLTDEVRELIRQAGFVSLWFFGKYIAGFAGPYDRLNEDLHLEMCNFRQSLLKPGSRGALFLPRGHLKSKIVDETGGGWELIRNPDLTIRLTNAIDDTAGDFMHMIKAIFDSNEFFAWLYSEYAVRSKSQPRWNETEIVLPNRTKTFKEASVEFGGIAGASEGHHYDLHIIDDMIGLAALNSNLGSNAVMESTKNWFWASEQSLLNSMRTSRIIVVGTRYAVDDVYDTIIKRAYKVSGHYLRDFKPNVKGKWHIYYRMAVEEGKVIFPEEFTKEGFEEMAENDWWTYVTQYLNDPEAGGLAELVDYKIKSCTVEWNSVDEQWFIHYKEDNEEKTLALVDCDLIFAGDPAATEKYISSKTSRSAVGALATSYHPKYFLVDLRVGYVTAAKFFLWFFSLANRFKDFYRGTFLEASGPFKIMGPLLKDAAKKAGVYLNLRPFAAHGDKDGRIRSTLQPILDRGELYVAEPYVADVREEQRTFPLAQKKDILDMMTMAINNSIKPLSHKELVRRQREDDEFENRQHNLAGG
ncbi:hypothetical protein LCGC14_1611310 [marine sediment metagenome]|uniref:Terminase large subunit gp17-like C-terminal domain-containing protein n=1 Tax=marine sediment metagenome TaxID=412755 RepID=A0A0F9IUX9_9ZZZZ